ncbi:hypothetical protein HDA39_004303 [Kribbella italica]|uniref:Uncharacterized protein n=1 Tax=Kribbella italica TaxID=1540520 RepID=A0A7W9MV92_9ACTN|nr:hypothetical protein [Kribbella italica]
MKQEKGAAAAAPFQVERQAGNGTPVLLWQR